MSTTQKVAAAFGAFFVLIAIVGVATGGLTMATTASLGAFPVNVVHDAVHLAFGVWGLLASRSFTAARTFGQVSGMIYLVLAVMGMVAPAGFGIVPLGGGDVWLHAALGIALAGFGFTAQEEAIATG